jgi:tetratricopeptide (TPR) repeat protein
MKAEHRHELKTNTLADMMGRAVQAVKTGPSRHNLLVTAVVVVVAVLALGGYLLWKDHKESRSALWLKVDDDQRKLDNAADAEEIKTALNDFSKTADANKGTVPAVVLRYDRARALLRRGLQYLYAPDQRDKALEDIKAAREAYAALEKDAAGHPLLIQEAMMSVAKADESTGDLDEAVKGYQKLAKAYPQSVLGKAAEARANYLEDPTNRARVQELYQKLDKEVTRLPPPPPAVSTDKK